MNRTILKVLRRGRKEDFWGYAPKIQEAHTQMDGRKMMPVNELNVYNEQLRYHEAEARLYKVLHQFKEINLDSYNTRLTFKQLNLDSLQTINVITAIEREFNTVFEEEVFDNFDCCEEILKHITSNRRAF